MLRAEYIDGKIVVGKFVSDVPVHAYGATRKQQRVGFINKVLEANVSKIRCSSSNYRERNQAICAEIGSATQIFKIAHGISCKHMYSDIPQQVFRRLCFNMHGISWERVQKVRSCLTIINQALLDGQDNLLPILVHEQKSPEQIKHLYGKGLWKRICKNSFTRNKLIVEGVTVRGMTSVESISYRNTLRSSLLYLHVDNKEQAQVMNTVCAGKYGDTGYCNRNMRLVRDTQRLVGERFSTKWSLDKIKQEHDATIDEINARRNRIEETKQYEFPKHFPLSVQDGDLSAKLITSSDDLYQEGKTMHHCVSCYHSSVVGGDYCVYSICKQDKRYSTVGYRKQNDVWRMDQHYMACNKQVEDIHATTLAEAIAHEMNRANNT